MSLHYCIMQVNNRSAKNVANIKKIMDSAGFVFVDRKYFSWKDRDPNQFLKRFGVRTDKWLECSHRGFPPFIGELGHLSSVADMLSDLNDKGFDQVLVFEDDCIIDYNFIEIVNKAIEYNFDIFHFSYSLEHWNNWGSEQDIIDDFAVKANFKKGLMYASLYSSSGIKKILNIIKRVGAVGAIDLSIDEYGRRGWIESLCVNPENIPSLETELVESQIDPENLRHT